MWVISYGIYCFGGQLKTELYLLGRSMPVYMATAVECAGWRSQTGMVFDSDAISR